MRPFFYLLLLSFYTTSVCCQVSLTEIKKLGNKKKIELDSNGWKKRGIYSLNINQSSQTGQGAGSDNFLLGINSLLNKAVHHKKGKYTFDGYLDFELGLVYTSSYKKFRKTIDRFDLTVDLEHSIGKNTHFTYGILGNVNTQLFSTHNFLSDYHEKISNFLSPGRALLSLGVDYKNETPDSYFSFFATPATIRWITKLDRDFYTNKKFGVDSFQRVYTEIGAFISIHYTKYFSKKASITSRLDLFSNYKRNPQNVDLIFNNLFSLNISKNFGLTFILDLFYDDDITKNLRVQQVSGLGLKLKL